MKLIRLILVFVLIVTAASCNHPLMKTDPRNKTNDNTLSHRSASVPITFNEDSAGTDNLIYLMAAASEHNPELSVLNYGQPKHFWINNFDDTTDYLKWSVNFPEGNYYQVWALLDSGSAVPLSLSVENTEHNLEISTRNIGWDKLDMGKIFIPSGANTLKLIRNGNSSGNIQIKSLELIKDSDLADYNSRIADFKKDTSWFSAMDYGVMFQYGAWGYPQTGDRKSIDQGAADFNVDNFINMVLSTGASYVVWSVTWHQYWMQAPITAFDSIMGHSDLTSERDLIGEIAQACKNNGLRFMLYYHQGIQEEPTWADKQNWPPEFTSTGTGDRSTFFDNWISVISDIGNRYGTNLDGFFFDDGVVYYPAPFERLGQAARAGNPDRLISYNPWVSARLTEFQDIRFGEGYHGTPELGSAPIGGRYNQKLWMR